MATVSQIALVDLDAFFLGVEMVVDPSLRGLPAAVGGGGSGNGGVVLSASYEARKHGVRSGMPLARARQLCPELHTVTPHHRLYDRASRAVMDCMRKVAPVVQQVSVDEAFVDLTGTTSLLGPALDVCARLQRQIRRRLGLDITVGLAANRLVAKIASGLAKPRGLLEVAPGHEASFLAPLGVGRMPGVGPVNKRRLEELALFTMGDLQRRSVEDLNSALGPGGGRLRARAFGIDGSHVSPSSRRRSIGHQRALGKAVGDAEVLRDHIRTLLASAMRRLRGGQLFCRTVEVAWRYPDMTNRSLHRTLPEPSDIDRDLWLAASPLLDQLLAEGRPVTRIALRLSNLEHGHHQLSLFDPGRGRDRRHLLMHALDDIRDQLGPGLIGFGKPGSRKTGLVIGGGVPKG